MTTETKDLNTQVNDLAGTLVQDDAGAWIAPEGSEASELLLHAAVTEKRRRTDQAAFTKSQQNLKAVETTRDKLAEHLIDNATMHITEEQREELDDLRVNDPEAWRSKLNTYENQTKDTMRGKVTEFSEAGDKAAELTAREAAYEDFKTSTGIELNDEVIDTQLPARYKEQLENGKMSFDDFLNKAKTFLTAERVIEGSTSKTKESEPNLGKLPGGSEPSEEAQEGDLDASYSGVTF